MTGFILDGIEACRGIFGDIRIRLKFQELSSLTSQNFGEGLSREQHQDRLNNQRDALTSHSKPNEYYFFDKIIYIPNEPGQRPRIAIIHYAKFVREK